MLGDVNVLRAAPTAASSMNVGRASVTDYPLQSDLKTIERFRNVMLDVAEWIEAGALGPPTLT